MKMNSNLNLIGRQMKRSADFFTANDTVKEWQKEKHNRSAQMNLTTEAIDREKRTVEVAFSSEFSVERWFGFEILNHEDSACDLSRLNNGGAVLFNHRIDEQIGVVERAWVDSDKVGRALIRFGNSKQAQEKFNDVADGILRHISVGYVIQEAEETSELNADGLRVYTINATKWQPYEISFVTVPADPSVGVGRNAFDDKGEFPKTAEQHDKADGNKSANRTFKYSTNEKDNFMDTQNQNPTPEQVERTRVAELIAIGEAYKDFGGERLAIEAIRNGQSKEQLQEKLLTAMRNKPTDTNHEAGLSEKEQANYSLSRAIHAAASGDWSAAGFERECSQEIARKLGTTARGFYVPTDAIVRSSNYTVGNAVSAGSLVENELRSQNLIGLLQEKMLLTQLGVTYLDGLVGDVTIPKVLTGHTSSWIAEDGTATASAATFGQIALRNKTISGRTQLSRKLLQQSSISIEQFARNSLLDAIAQGIDVAAFYGTGADSQPTGLLNTAGIGNIDVKGNIEWKHIVQLEAMVDDSMCGNGDNMSYITSRTVKGYLKTKPHEGMAHAGYIWQEGKTLNGYSAIASKRMVDPKTNKSAMLFGDFSQFLVGSWGVLDLLVDPYSSSESGAVKIVAFQDVDFAVRYAEAFAAVKNINVTY